MSKINPQVTITLDKERHLLLDLNAMAAFEEVTGKTLFGGIDLNKQMGAYDLRALLWACLVHEDESLTLKQVGAFINTQNMSQVAANLTEAFTNAVAEDGEKKRPLVQNLQAG